MSSYKRKTKNPVTGEWENALWFDDYFGKHHYGVIFPSQPKKVYDPRNIKLEIIKNENSI